MHADVVTTTTPSPIGRWVLYAEGDALVGLYGDAMGSRLGAFAAEPRLRPSADATDGEGAGVPIPARFLAAREAPEHPVLVQARRELAEHFAGTRATFTVPLRPSGTAFQQRVWAALRTIPQGTTTTYGALARAIGAPAAARAVGLANARNPISVIVPCHRVVGADGSLVGYAWGLARKRWLLEHEQRAAAARAA